MSPDGKAIAAIGPDRRIAIYPVAPGEPRAIPGLTPEDHPIRWSADGRSLYVANPVARPRTVDLVDIQTGKRALWRQFQAPDPAGVFEIEPFVLSPDGSSYVYSYRRVIDDLYAVTGLR